MRKHEYSRWILLLAALCAAFLCVACGDTEKTEASVGNPFEDVFTPEKKAPVTVEILGKKFDPDAEDISFSGVKMPEDALRQLTEKLPLLEKLKSVDLRKTDLTDMQVFSVAYVFPEVDFKWDLELCGLACSLQDTELDFTGLPVDLRTIQQVFPLMHHLEYVDFTDCGLEDEDLEALNLQYENTRVVWTLHIGEYDIRTDDTVFRSYSENTSMFTIENLNRLYYCHDIICLDLGHRQIRDLQFLKGMPHIKYLVLLESRAGDISPIGTLKELVYLELLCSKVDDLSPLLGCTALEDLNIVANWGAGAGAKSYDTIMKLDWVKRLWVDKDVFANKGDQEALEAAHPDIMYKVTNGYIPGGYADPWRYCQNYYDMRDMLGLWYMNGKNALIDYKIIDGVRYELDDDVRAYWIEKGWIKEV